MRKNDAGLTVLEKGDVVRIGKGKVLYTVVLDQDSGTHVYGALSIKSHNTGRISVEMAERLTLVTNVRDSGEKMAELIEAEEVEAQKFDDELFQELNLPITDQGTFKEEPVVEPSAYAKAILFALSKLGKHVYAGTVSETKKAKTRKLNRRQKASRKANR